MRFLESFRSIVSKVEGSRPPRQDVLREIFEITHDMTTAQDSGVSVETFDGSGLGKQVHIATSESTSTVETQGSNHVRSVAVVSRTYDEFLKMRIKTGDGSMHRGKQRDAVEFLAYMTNFSH